MRPKSEQLRSPRYDGDVQIELVARELGISRQRVAAIIRRAEQKIRAALRRKNIKSVDDVI